jgi:hypothetical protein
MNGPLPYLSDEELVARERERERIKAERSKPNGSGGEASGEPEHDPDYVPPGEKTAGREATPNFRTLKEFCAEFRPISYAVAGLMREGTLYTFTGRTGEGKTSFLVILALAIATGRKELIGRKVKTGRVAFCTAENPDDLRMRLMVACFILNIDIDVIDCDIMISDNRVTPEAITEWVKASGETFTLIIVDTWQAYFDLKDANNPTQAVEFTRRFRPLAGLGSPVVVVAAHPVKNASDDNLLPYGGGSTLNEVDGNFTMLRDETGLYRFHWLGKIRGLPFDPLHFRIDKLDSPDVVTVEDVRVPMPVMFPIGEEDVEAREDRLAKRDLALLKAMAAEPTGSIRTWALGLNTTKRAVEMALKRLKKDRLVVTKARRWTLTKDGDRMVKETNGIVESDG